MSKIETSQYRLYIEFLNKEYQISFKLSRSSSLSVNDQDTFWASITRFFSVDFDKPFSKVMNRSDKPWKTTWFDGAELSYKHVFYQFSNSDQQSFIKVKRAL